MPQSVSDIMTRDVSFCRPEDPISVAAQKMKENVVGSIPVCSDEQLMGMITDRDIVVRCVAEQKPNSTQVSEVMSTDIVSGTPDMSVDEVAHLMAENQIRRLPIIEGTKLVGICALGDLAIDDQFEDEAEIALSEISESRPGDQPTAH